MKISGQTSAEVKKKQFLCGEALKHFYLLFSNKNKASIKTIIMFLCLSIYVSFSYGQTVINFENQTTFNTRFPVSDRNGIGEFNTVSLGINPSKVIIHAQGNVDAPYHPQQGIFSSQGLSSEFDFISSEKKVSFGTVRLSYLVGGSTYAGILGITSEVPANGHIASANDAILLILDRSSRTLNLYKRINGVTTHIKQWSLEGTCQPEGFIQFSKLAIILSSDSWRLKGTALGAGENPDITISDSGFFSTPFTFANWGSNFFVALEAIQSASNNADRWTELEVSSIYTFFPGNCYYVAPNGNDNNTGTFSYPWETAAKGLSSLSPGDVLFFKEGSYELDNEIILADMRGSSSNVYYVRSYENGEAHLTGYNRILLQRVSYWDVDGIIFDQPYLQIGYWSTDFNDNIVFRNCLFSNQHSNAVTIISQNNNYITFDNCHFYRIESQTEYIDRHAIVADAGVNYLTVKHCKFEDIAADGIQLGHHGTDIRHIVIEDCSFWINRYSDGTLVDEELQTQWGNCGEDGIDLKNVQGPATIKNCSFRGYRKTVPGQNCSGGQGTGIALHGNIGGGDGLGARNITIDSCLFEDNSSHIVLGSAGGVPSYILIKNNILRYGRYTGLFCRDASFVEIYHNLIYGNGYNLQLLNVSSADCAFKDNLMYDGEIYGDGDMEMDYNCYGSGSPIGSNDIVVPGIGKQIRWDGVPLINCNAIGAGVYISGVNVDYIGNIRGNPPDIGAVEYVSNNETLLMNDDFDDGNWANNDLDTVWIEGTKSGSGSSIVEANNVVTLNAYSPTGGSQMFMHSNNAMINFFNRPTRIILKGVNLDYEGSGSSGIYGYFLIQSTQQRTVAVESGIWLCITKVNGGSISLYRKNDSSSSVLLAEINNLGKFTPGTVRSIEIFLDASSYSLLVIDADGYTEKNQGAHGAESWGNSYISAGAYCSVADRKSILNIDDIYVEEE